MLLSVVYCLQYCERERRVPKLTRDEGEECGREKSGKLSEEGRRAIKEESSCVCRSAI